MPLKTLIVDDEPIARKVLREELSALEDIEITGEAENGVVALKRIAEHQPDLVLLDLQMPGMGGLDVVRNLRHGTRMPVIVIITAFDQYALQAFEAGAIDYLLKPVGEKRLADAVERARRVTGKQAAERLAHLQEIAERPAISPIQTNRWQSRRGIFSAERRRDLRIPGGRRYRLDHYRQEEVSRHTDPKGA